MNPIGYGEMIKNNTITNYSQSQQDKKDQPTRESQGGQAKMTEEQITWDEALDNNNYVRLEEDKQVTLLLTEWKLQRVEKFGEELVEFTSKVLEENGVPVDKLFSTTSNRLKSKLRPIFQNLQGQEKVRISILPIGSNFERQYGVNKIE